MATWYSQGSGLWSTLANWNDAANGSGSAPGSIAAFDNSPVVIQAGHVVEFDVEDAVACDGSVSDWTTGIAGITVTGSAAGTPGELTLTDTVNNANRVYGLRLKADTAIVGTNVAVLGKVTGGTSSVPLPTGAVHIIQFVDPPTTGGFDLTYLSLALYAAPPVETAYVTTADADIGDSVLSVQGRLTGCNPNTDTTEWQVGRAVRVVRTTSAGVNTQATTIADVGDGTITLADNLTVAKPAGSLVVLEQRNIEIRDSAATSNNHNLITNGTGAELDCAIRSLRSAASGTRAIFYGTSHTVQGSAVISGCTYGIHSGTSHIVQNSATISGCSLGINLGTSNAVQGSAVISGCTYGIFYGTSHTVQGSAVISGCTHGIYQSANALVAHTASITGCTTNYRVDTAHDSVFSYTTPVGGTDVFATYKRNVAPAVFAPRVEIWPTGYEAAGTAEVTRRYPSTYIYGEYPRTWCNGGKTQSQTSVLPTGHTVGGQMIFEQHADIISAGVKANYTWNWVSVPVSVGASETKTFTVHVRKDTSFSGYTETPIVEIVDTLYDGTNIDLTAAVATASMIDTEDDWQQAVFSISTEGDYFVRIRGRHDTGNLYYTIMEDETPSYTWYSQGSDLWSTLSNWNSAADGSGVTPLTTAAFDNSPVVIQAGHVIEFDVEDAVACDGSVSGWTTGIAGITITGAASGTPGELTLTDTVNNANRVYGLRLKANTAIVGTNVAVLGKVTGGTESVPLPTGAVHIIQFLDPPTTGGFNLTYLSLALYCAPPVETAYVTTANAGIGDSVLSVQGRLTGCNPNTDTTEWQVGRAVRVVRTTSAGVDTQATTIASVGDGTITLSDNLTVAKLAGSLVVLGQRNIEIRDSAATSDTRNIIANGTGAIIDCAIRSMRSTTSGTRGIYAGTSHIVQGSAVISGCIYGIHSGTSHIVQGSAVISGCTYGIHSVTSHIVQGSAVISGCTYGTAYGTSNIVQGSAVISGCSSGIIFGTSNAVQGSAVISGCTYGIYQSANALVAHTASITGCTTNYHVNTADDSVFSYTTPVGGTDVFATYKLNVAPAVATPRVEIWPSGYEAAGTGDVTRRYPSTFIEDSYPKTWGNGGKTEPQTSVLPTGFTTGGKMIFEQHADIISAGIKANYCWNWVSFPFSVTAGSTKTFTIYVRKDTSFSGYTETPIIEIVDTLYDGTNIDLTAAVETVSMEDNEDTWQKYILQTDVAGDYFVRIRGRHDTGTLYYVVTEDQTTWYSQGSSTWSDLSNWNDAADGSGLEPREVYYFNNQKVVIQAGHVIEFDVEDAVACDGSVSGWTTGIAGITITGAAAGNTPGELTLTDTVNNANRVYGLRIKAGSKVVGTSVAVLGKVTGGTSSVSLPTGAVHIIQFLDPLWSSGGFDLRYLSFAMYCAAPVETVYVTTAAAGVGDSVLSVQGRLTACNPNTDTTEWQVGRAVRVIRTTSAGANTQATTIAAVGDGTITLGDNLTVAKPAGSLVVLEQRNIEIRDSAATSNGRNLIANGTGAVLDCAIRSLRSAASGTSGISEGTSHTVQGSAVISGCTRGISYGIWHTVQGSATISGCTSGIDAGTWHIVQGSAVISGCLYGIYIGSSHTVQGSATISGCTSGIINGTSHIVQGSATISGCTSGIINGTSHTVQDSATISGCAYGIYQSANALVAHTATISGCSINYRVDTANASVFSYSTPANGTIVHSGYKLNVAPAVATPRVEIWPTGYEAAGTAAVTRRYPSTYIYGSYPRTWCNGGKTQSQSSVLPTGHTVGGQMIFEQHADIISAGVKANYTWNWVAVPVTVGGNQRAKITVNVRKDTSFSGYTETPMVQVVDALYDGTDIDVTYEQTSSMTDNQNTWQTKSFTVDTPGLHFVRIIGRHDTGNLYYTVTVGYEYTGVGGAQVKPARGWRVTDGPYDDIYRGLQGLWLMNVGSGTIVADASGHGRHGTANGTPGWIAGAAGWDYAVNRTDNGIAIANRTTSSTTGHTVVVRFRASAATAGLQNLLTQHLNSAGSYGFAVWLTADMAVSYRSGTGANAYVGTTANGIVAGDTWTHLTATYTSGMKRLYLNGAEVTSGSLPQTTHTGTFWASATPLGIGNWEPNADTVYGLSGAIDYAAIWSRALSAQEVRRLHEQPPWCEIQ